MIFLGQYYWILLFSKNESFYQGLIFIKRRCVIFRQLYMINKITFSELNRVYTFIYIFKFYFLLTKNFLEPKCLRKKLRILKLVFMRRGRWHDDQWRLLFDLLRTHPLLSKWQVQNLFWGKIRDETQNWNLDLGWPLMTLVLRISLE